MAIASGAIPFCGLHALLLSSVAAQSFQYDNSLDDGINMDPLPAMQPMLPSTPVHTSSPVHTGGGFTSSSCQFSPPGTGLQFDLSAMAQTEHDFTGTTGGGYVYRFNVCKNTLKVCSDKPAPASKWRGSKCNNLGDADTMKMSLLDEHQPTKGLRLAFEQGDICKKQSELGQTEMGSRVVTYEVYCDASEPGKLREIQEVSMCEYKVLFDSKAACPVSSGRPSGWSMIAIFVVAVAMYCAIGIAYNKYFLAMQGLDAIPNRAMWEELPGLVKEGMSFTIINSKAGAEMAREKAGPALESLGAKAWPALEWLREKARGQAPGL